MHGTGYGPRRFGLGPRDRLPDGNITAAGVNDIVRIQAAVQRHGCGFRLAPIDDDVSAMEAESLDRDYLRALFDCRFGKARARYPWKPALPV